MNITDDLMVHRTLHYNIYQVERKLFDAQPISEGYLHDFSHQFNVTWRCNSGVEIKQIVTVIGHATCNCSFGFNIYIHKITSQEAQPCHP